MRILIAAGGTGGHIYPALAVARSLRERAAADLELRWLGGRRGLEGRIVRDHGLPIDRLWVRSLRSVELSLHTVLDPLRLMLSVPQAVAMLIRRRPAVIFTTGGYLAIPVLIAATLLRIPAVMWEGNLLAGRSVRATARLANALAVSFADTCAQLPGPCYVTGTPIRSFDGLERAGARAALGLPPDVPAMLIFGGSQAVRRLNDAVAQVLPELVQRASLVHVCGEAELAGAQANRERLPETLRVRYQPHAFMDAEMSAALVAAEIIVGRAGSSTLAEAAALGTPIVVVPYPHASGHQRANARLLADAGAAIVVADKDFDADALRSAVELLADPARLAPMREAARTLGRPGAANAVAELVMAMAGRHAMPLPSAIDELSRAGA
jgi:UDP-N-acetylglucosamine--N-acetylmuramyl-(pentapeptide) pyrophosphoryl-undecaprenol N-acetylglucosamine transferase